MAKKTSDQLAVRKRDAEVLAQAKEEIEEALDMCKPDVLALEKSPIGKAMALASGMTALRAAMTDQVVEQLFMPLQGSALGFTTDRDHQGQKYPVAVVRDVLIEGMIKGLRPVNNEITIISGRCYGAKNGMCRMVREDPRIRDLRLEFGAPTIAGDEARVSVIGSYKFNGEPIKINRTKRVLDDGAAFDSRIVVRVNKGMGADAVLGKALRKMYHAIYEAHLGQDELYVNTADEDSIEVQAEVVSEPEEPRLPQPKAETQPKRQTSQDAPSEATQERPRRKASLKRPSDPRDNIPPSEMDKMPQPDEEEGEVAEQDEPQLPLS